LVTQVFSVIIGEYSSCSGRDKRYRKRGEHLHHTPGVAARCSDAHRFNDRSDQLLLLYETEKIVAVTFADGKARTANLDGRTSDGGDGIKSDEEGAVYTYEAGFR
jgi:hypothetical protein